MKINNKLLRFFKIMFYGRYYRAYLKHLCKKNKDYCNIVIFGGAIGDCCIAMAYLLEFRKKLERKINIIVSESLKELVQCYDGYDKVTYVSKQAIVHMEFVTTRKFPWTWYFKQIDTPQLIITNPWIYLDRELLKLRDLNCLNIMRDIIYHLNENVRCQTPQIKYNQNIHIRGKKNILFNPFSNSMQCDPNIFNEIIDYFKLRGYNLYTNCINNDAFCFPGTERLVSSIFDLYNLIDQFECIVSIRSGILDLLASKNIKQIVLYDPNAGYKNLYSLKMWGINALELYYDDNKIIEKINTFLEQ